MSLYEKVFNHLKASSTIDPSLLSLLPRSYKRIGHIALLNLDERLLPWKNNIGEAFLYFLSDSIKTMARFTRPIHGIVREPSIEVIAGDARTETIHIEHQTKFYLDPAKVMFSAGNHNERKRAINFVNNLLLEKGIQVNSGKRLVILDMFACVGNLSLPIAKNLQNVEIIALEINQIAMEYLVKSLHLNKIPEPRYKVFLGDNELQTPENVADLVIMGYFGISETQLTKALLALNQQNTEGWIMIHDTGNIDADSLVLQNLFRIVQLNEFWEIKQVNKHKIKSIGPGLEHWVFDCYLKRKLLP